jgi:hypothetical protein
MSRYVLTGSQLFYGPTVVDRDKLDQFDDVLKNTREIVFEESDKECEHAVEEDLKELNVSGKESEVEREKILNRLRSYYKKSYDLRIIIDEHRAVKVDSFADAHASTDIIQTDPVGFEASIDGSRTKAEISVSGGYIYINVSPKDSETAQRIFGLLMSWVNEVKPKAYRKLWEMLHPIQWMFFVLGVGLLLGFSMVKTDSGRKALEEKAQQILVGGISPDEELAALEIMLTLETNNYPKSTRKIKITPTFCAGTTLLLFISILLSFPPRTAIGIGKGEHVVRRIHRIEKVLFISFPLIVLIGIIIPLLRTWVFG